METIDNEQATVQEVPEETINDETTTEGTTEQSSSNTNLSNSSSTDVAISSETSSGTSEVSSQANTEEQPPNETPGETTKEVESPGEFSTLLIEEKLDTLIQLESHQFGADLFMIGAFSAFVVIYLLYKFITNFFEF